MGVGVGGRPAQRAFRMQGHKHEGEGSLAELCGRLLFKVLDLSHFFCPRKRTEGVGYLSLLLPASSFSPRPVATCPLVLFQDPTLLKTRPGPQQKNTMLLRKKEKYSGKLYRHARQIFKEFLGIKKKKIRKSGFLHEAITGTCFLN